MRILLSCQQALRSHSVPAYQFWETYFKKGIEEAGHEWVEADGLDWAEGLVNPASPEIGAWRERTWERLLEFVKTELKRGRIDLFLGYLFPYQVEPEAVREIRRLGIPCVNFFCDNVRDLRSVPAEYRCFDLHWVPEFKALDMYRKAGQRYLHLPMPVWVDPKHRTPHHSENYGVTFIGSRDQLRERLFLDAARREMQMEIRGAGWGETGDSQAEPSRADRSPWKTLKNQIDFIQNHGPTAWVRKMRSLGSPESSAGAGVLHPFVRPKPDPVDYVAITQQSTITLGVNRYPSYRHPARAPDTYSRLRDLEAPMMGACYLTEWTDGLDRLYDLGREIETYRSADELVEKTRELLENPEKRRSMRQMGQKRALAEHSLPMSLANLAAAIGIR